MTDEIPEWVREKARAVLRLTTTLEKSISTRQWEVLEEDIACVIIEAYDIGRKGEKPQGVLEDSKETKNGF